MIYHVDDLGERDLQRHVDDVVRVLHRPQSTGVVGEQVAHQLLGVATMSGEAAYSVQQEERPSAKRAGIYTNACFIKVVCQLRLDFC